MTELQVLQQILSVQEQYLGASAVGVSDTFVTVLFFGGVCSIGLAFISGALLYGLLMRNLEKTTL